jgi:hypothetical protein
LDHMKNCSKLYIADFVIQNDQNHDCVDSSHWTRNFVHSCQSSRSRSNPTQLVWNHQKWNHLSFK